MPRNFWFCHRGFFFKFFIFISYFNHVGPNMTISQSFHLLLIWSWTLRWFWGGRDFISLPLHPFLMNSRKNTPNDPKWVFLYNTNSWHLIQFFSDFWGVFASFHYKDLFLQCNAFPWKERGKILQLFKLTHELGLEKSGSNFYWLDKISTLCG